MIGGGAVPSGCPWAAGPGEVRRGGTDSMEGSVPATGGEPGPLAVLGEPRKRVAMGRLFSRVLNPRPRPSGLAQDLAKTEAEARAAGPTDAELEADSAERRGATLRCDRSRRFGCGE